MSVDPYTDPAIGLLHNRFGITDADRLGEAEAVISLAALAELVFRIAPGAYDLEHLCALQREIFGDIHPWAGEIRPVGGAKSDPFCLPQNIQTYSVELFDSLAKERFLRGFSCDRLGQRHPSLPRAQRGTQRAFFRRLAQEAGWPIGWSTLTAAGNTEASMASLRGDNRLLHDLVDSVIRRR